jgi:hypothetical protein
MIDDHLYGAWKLSAPSRDVAGLARFKLKSILRFLVDPRVLLGFGVLFFGGIVAAAELSQHLEKRKKPPPSSSAPEDK